RMSEINNPAGAVSLTDPRVILAGIRRFGLAPDGSDLRDLEAAIDRLYAAQGEVVGWQVILDAVKKRLTISSDYDFRPWSQIERTVRTTLATAQALASPPPAPAWRTMERIQQ